MLWPSATHDTAGPSATIGRPCRAPPSVPIPAASCAPSMSAQRVTLAGWVHRRRDHGHLAFFDLRDRHGLTQVVTSAEEGARGPCRRRAGPATSGSCRSRARSRHRPEGTANAELATGEVEVAVDRFEVLNPSKVPPFYINEEQPGLDEALRLKHRYLDLRRPPMQERMLLRCAPGIGAFDGRSRTRASSRSRRRCSSARRRRARATSSSPRACSPGVFYALPQSPQQLKQLLMVAGYDRYYQLAHCMPRRGHAQGPRSRSSRRSTSR